MYTEVRRLSRTYNLTAAAALFFPLLSVYLFFCPAVNLELYQLFAVHPTHEPLDLSKPIQIMGVKGEHTFFPVLKDAGPQVLMHGIYFKNKCARALVLVSPSNAFCLAHFVKSKQIAHLLKLGFDVFMYDYEGFGKSQGKADYRKLGNDGISAYTYVTQKLQPKSVILYGLSMGTGVSAYVAQRKKADAVILDSPYVSPEKTIKLWQPVLNLYPSFFFPGPHFDNDTYIKGAHPPTMILNMGLDKVTYPEQGETLYKVASQPVTYQLLPNSIHGLIAADEEDTYSRSINEFVSQIRLAAPGEVK